MANPKPHRQLTWRHVFLGLGTGLVIEGGILGALGAANGTAFVGSGIALLMAYGGAKIERRGNGNGG